MIDQMAAMKKQRKNRQNKLSERRLPRGRSYKDLQLRQTGLPLSGKPGKSGNLTNTERVGEKLGNFGKKTRKFEGKSSKIKIQAEVSIISSKFHVSDCRIKKFYLTNELIDKFFFLFFFYPEGGDGKARPIRSKKSVNFGTPHEKPRISL